MGVRFVHVSFSIVHFSTDFITCVAVSERLSQTTKPYRRLRLPSPLLHYMKALLAYPERHRQMLEQSENSLIGVTEDYRTSTK